MKKIAVFVALLLVLGAIPGWCLCADTWINEQANSENYAVKSGGMLLRGIHRIVESPAEIGYHVYDGAVHKTEYGVGVLRGLGTGLLWTFDGVIRGAWDIVTFAFPDYHGEPGTHDLVAEIKGGGAA